MVYCFRLSGANRFEFYHTVRLLENKEINFFKQHARRGLNARRLWWVYLDSASTHCGRCAVKSSSPLPTETLTTSLLLFQSTVRQKASFSLFKTISTRKLVSWRLSAKNQLKFTFPLLGGYRVRMWTWNMNSNKWTWFEFQKASPREWICGKTRAVICCL